MNALTGRIRLDFRSQEPIYLQIVRQIEQLVVDGTLKPGYQLPTVRQMAIDLRINYSTVARAYKILDEKRLISTQRGRGTYIWEADHLDGQTVENPESFPDDPAREELANQLARNFMDAAIHQGLTVLEIWQAFEREAASRNSTEKAIKEE